MPACNSSCCTGQIKTRRASDERSLGLPRQSLAFLSAPAVDGGGGRGYGRLAAALRSRAAGPHRTPAGWSGRKQTGAKRLITATGAVARASAAVYSCFFVALCQAGLNECQISALPSGPGVFCLYNAESGRRPCGVTTVGRQIGLLRTRTIRASAATSLSLCQQLFIV